MFLAVGSSGPISAERNGNNHMQRIESSTKSLLRILPALRLCFLTICLFSVAQHVWAQPDVVGHWRLEPGNDFFLDSVGNAHLEFNGAEAQSVSLPAGDRGELFPKELAGIGQNLGGASFGPGVGELISEEGPLLDEDFTIEVFANIHNFAASNMSAHLAAQTNPANASGSRGLSEFSWTLHVRMDGRDGSEPRELFLVTSDGFGWQHIESNILIDENKDYFMASAFDLDPGEATFYVHDLESNRLQINTAPRPTPQVPLNATNHFAIGGFETETHRHQLHGVVDEVRLSEGIVEPKDLLNGQNVSPDSGPLQIELGPRALFEARDQRARDLRIAARSNVDDSRRVVSQFDLPEVPGAALKLDEAKLRLFVDPTSDPETAELSLWHSPIAGDFVISSDGFADESYVDTGLRLSAEGDDAGRLVELDVTDLVRQDYLSGLANPVSAFRIQSIADSTFRVEAGDSTDRRPQLLMTIDQHFGDFDRDGSLDVSDINQLSVGIAKQNTNFDINRDGSVDQSDLTAWVHELKGTWIGDSNLDGEFNSGDLVHVFQAGHYEDDIGMNSGWAEGDWNGDGDFDTADLVFAFQDGGYERGARLSHAVPEPKTYLAMVALVGLLVIRGRRLRR